MHTAHLRKSLHSIVIVVCYLSLVVRCVSETTCTLAKDFAAYVFKATSEDEVGWCTLLHFSNNSTGPHHGDTHTRARARARTIFFVSGRRVPKIHSCCSSSCSWNQFSRVQKIPKAFLIPSGAQRNFAYTFVLIFPTDLPSQIFHLFSN